MTDAGRIETIEIKLAHLERGLQQLSDVVVRQQREIAALVERNRVLADELRALLGQLAPPDPLSQAPPHG